VEGVDKIKKYFIIYIFSLFILSQNLFILLYIFIIYIYYVFIIYIYFSFSSLKKNLFALLPRRILGLMRGSAAAARNAFWSERAVCGGEADETL